MSEISFDLKKVQEKKESYARHIHQMGEEVQTVNSGIYACSCSGGCEGGCEDSCSGRCSGCGKS